MPLTVHLSKPLRPLAAGRARLTVEGGTVGEALRAVADRCPDLGRRLFAAEGQLSGDLRVYLGDQEVRLTGGLEAPVEDGDILTVIAPQAMGRG